MIFLRNFYDDERKVNTKHRWVWYFHIVSYAYIIYVYYLTDAAEIDASESSKIWIPLDIILTSTSLYTKFSITTCSTKKIRSMNVRAKIKIKTPFKVQQTLETQIRLHYLTKDRTQLEVIFLREAK